MLLGCLVMVALAVGDALQDKTPRRPWSWRRPELEWFYARHSKAERAGVAMGPIGKKG